MRSPRETVAFYAGYFGWRQNKAETGPVTVGKEGEGPSQRENRLWRNLLRPEAGNVEPKRKPADDTE